MTGFFQKILTKISNGVKILNFELLAVSFCMGPTIICCLNVFHQNAQKLHQKKIKEGGQDKSICCV